MSNGMVGFFIVAIFVFGALWEILRIRGYVESLRSEIKSLRADLKEYLINIDDNVSGLCDNKSIKQQLEEARKIKKGIEEKK